MGFIRSLIYRWKRRKWRRQATVIEGDYHPHRNELVENTWIKGTVHIGQPNVTMRDCEVGGVVIETES